MPSSANAGEKNRIEHSLSSLIAQRVYGLVMGYEDINDHETLRHDKMFALAVGKALNSGQEPIALAGKSTLNRIEHCPENVSSMADSRYHRIDHNPEAIETLLVELFLESHLKPPRQITLLFGCYRRFSTWESGRSLFQSLL